MSPRHQISVHDAGAPARQPETLTFHARWRFGQKQPRLKNRYRLEPEIDLKRYRAHAVLDFIDLVIETDRPTQFRYVQECVSGVWGGRKPHVETLSDDKNSATRFQIRLQEPALWDLRAVETALQRKFGMPTPVRVGMVEVSVDLYARNASYADRVRMVALVQRLYRPHHDDMWTEPSFRPRMVYERDGAAKTEFFLPLATGDKSKLNLDSAFDSSLVRELRADATVYFGARSGDVQIRLQNKVSDVRSGAAALALPAEQCRARIEVTLSGAELERLGISTIDGMERFSFNKLQGDYFSFALPTFPHDPDRLLVQRLNPHINKGRVDTFLRAGVAVQERVEKLREEWYRKPTPLLSGHSRWQHMSKTLRALGKPLRRDRIGKGTSGHSVASYA